MVGEKAVGAPKRASRTVKIHCDNKQNDAVGNAHAVRWSPPGMREGTHGPSHGDEPQRPTNQPSFDAKGEMSQILCQAKGLDSDDVMTIDG